MDAQIRPAQILDFIDGEPYKQRRVVDAKAMVVPCSDCMEEKLRTFTNYFFPNTPCSSWILISIDRRTLQAEEVCGS